MTYGYLTFLTVQSSYANTQVTLPSIQLSTPSFLRQTSKTIFVINHSWSIHKEMEPVRKSIKQFLQNSLSRTENQISHLDTMKKSYQDGRYGSDKIAQRAVKNRQLSVAIKSNNQKNSKIS